MELVLTGPPGYWLRGVVDGLSLGPAPPAALMDDMVCSDRGESPLWRVNGPVPTTGLFWFERLWCSACDKEPRGGPSIGLDVWLIALGDCETLMRESICRWADASMSLPGVAGRYGVGIFC